MPACCAAPAKLAASTACPWPFMTMLGIHTPTGVTPASKTVPLWTSAGVVVRLPISYQRDPSRSNPAPLPPTPALLTRMLCAVHSVLAPVKRFVRTSAANKRSSSASRGDADPLAGCAEGKNVVGTVIGIMPVNDGVAPGVLTRYTSSFENAALSTPMKYPSVADGSPFCTPCGVHAPAPPPTARPRNAVTTIGPPAITLDLRITY